MSFQVGVKATGLPDMGGQVATFQDKLPGLVAEINLKAAELVSNEARPTVPVDSGRAASSVQAYMTGGIAITQGGDGVDYYWWLEVGGISGHHGSNKRQVVPEGRYIWPAYERMTPQVQNLMETALSNLTSAIFKS